MNKKAYRDYIHTEIQKQLPEYLKFLRIQEGSHNPPESVEELLQFEELAIYLREDFKSVLVIGGDWATFGGAYDEVAGKYDLSGCSIFDDIVKAGLSTLGLESNLFQNIDYEIEAEWKPNIIREDGSKETNNNSADYSSNSLFSGPEHFMYYYHIY